MNYGIGIPFQNRFGGMGFASGPPDKDDLIQWITGLKADDVTFFDKVETVTIEEPTLTGLNCLNTGTDATSKRVYGKITTPTNTEKFAGFGWIWLDPISSATRNTLVEGYYDAVIDEGYHAGYLDIGTTSFLVMGGQTTSVCQLVDPVPFNEWVFIEWELQEGPSFLRMTVADGTVYEQTDATGSPLPQKDGYNVGTYRAANDRFFDGAMLDFHIQGIGEWSMQEGDGLICHDISFHNNQMAVLDSSSAPVYWTKTTGTGKRSTNHSDGFSDGLQTEPDFSFAVIPDMQESSGGLTSNLWPDITNWITANQTAEKIEAIIMVGDICEGTPTQVQFDVAMPSITAMDGLGIPNLYTTGNHDYDVQAITNHISDVWDANMTVERMTSQSWFDGGFWSEHPETNNYCRFTIAGEQFLVINVDTAPYQENMDWVVSVIRSHSGYNVIVNPHMFSTADGTLLDDGDYGSVYDYPIRANGGMSGPEIWDRLKGEPNLFHVTCGHVLVGDGGIRDYWAGVGTGGNIVTSVVANWQYADEKEFGNIFLYKFFLETNLIEIQKVVTTTGDQPTDGMNNFKIPYRRAY